MISPLLRDRAGTPHGFAAPGDPAPEEAWRPHQVHGCRVVAAPEGPAPAEDADGVVSAAPGRPVGVRTADCAAILVAADDGSVVAALHAGWRGLAAGIVEAGVAALRSAGAQGPLLAAIGPCARGCCYEVGPEVLAALSPGPGRAMAGGGDRFLLDLHGVVVDRLTAAGLAPADIDLVGGCTICSAGLPSYRREGAAAGRILAWIAPRGAR